MDNEYPYIIRLHCIKPSCVLVASLIQYTSGFPLNLLQNIRNAAFEAASRIAVLDTSALPPFVQRARATIMNTVQLFHDVKTDVMELYHVSFRSIIVILRDPVSPSQ